MKFDFTPEEAQSTANALARHYSRLKMKVSIEVAAWPDAPCKTTLIAKKASKCVLVEAQGTLNYHDTLRKLASWMAVRRLYAELYLATVPDADMKAGMLDHLKRDGVGLLIVDDRDVVSVFGNARNHALVVTPDPTLKYGECKAEMLEAIRKFNDGNRKDGLRDLCETVERVTEEVALLAVRKGLLKMSDSAIKAKDWSGQIDTLESQNAYNLGCTPVIATTFKTDLHSFRGARNLVDHPARTKRDNEKRERQFSERMMQGPRLVAELVSLKRRLK